MNIYGQLFREASYLPRVEHNLLLGDAQALQVLDSLGSNLSEVSDWLSKHASLSGEA